MTVNELIEELRKYDGDMPVIVRDDEGDGSSAVVWGEKEMYQGKGSFNECFYDIDNFGESSYPKVKVLEIR